MADNGRCRSCGAAILWVKNDKTGKVAPIDVAADSGGPITLNDDGTYHVLTKADRAANIQPWDRFTNHWQTCRDRLDWKKVYR